MRMRLGILAVALLSSSIGCARSGSSEPPPSTGGAPAAVAAQTRGKVFAVEGRGYAYDYYDVWEPDSHTAFLQKKGLQGGGPTWAGIVYGLLKLRRPELIAEVELDDEAEGLRIWSESRAPLEAIASLIAEVKANEHLLQQAIDVARGDGRME